MNTNGHTKSHDEPVHISVVLDRSGSMSGIADDIVGGFNAFLADQRTQPGIARVTLAQFDSDDPFEVLIDGVDLREVGDLDRSRYQPRSTTPLYDAVARMIAKVDAEIAGRAQWGAPTEDQVVAIITDGAENASQEQTRSTVFDMINDRRKQGWVFVFLGANQDVYAEGERMAVPVGNRAAWKSTPEGTKEMWGNVARSTTAHRMKSHDLREIDADKFFEESEK